MDDLRELLELLNRHEVEYLIIGAHAVAKYGYPRATKDIDLWIRKEVATATKVAAALKEFGADIGEAGTTELAGPANRMVRFGVAPNMVDILNFTSYDDFDEVWQGRVEGEFIGVSVHFPSKAALIEMKRRSGRPQDLVDIQKLEG
ncbi:MAG: hypothetical protein IT206_07255 [Fimbriimonadaceae bacterium]|nr:hypothetical protein [Fimbriimonadaceae bacterium]